MVNKAVYKVSCVPADPVFHLDGVAVPRSDRGFISFQSGDVTPNLHYSLLSQCLVRCGAVTDTRGERSQQISLIQCDSRDRRCSDREPSVHLHYISFSYTDRVDTVNLCNASQRLSGFPLIPFSFPLQCNPHE